MSAKVEVEQKIIQYLTKRMFKKACVAVAEYEAKQVYSRGIGIDWKHYNPKHQVEVLTKIFNNKPEMLSKLDSTKLESLRIGAAMMELWEENTASKWLPSSFETGLSIDNDSAARMLLFKSQNNTAVKQYKKMGVSQYVEVLATPESCEACTKLQHKRYKVEEAPELPNPSCTHKYGCRCVYIPCIK